MMTQAQPMYYQAPMATPWRFAMPNPVVVTRASAWLAAAARKELLVRTGLDGVADFDRESGPFTDEEKADAAEWAARAIERSRRSGPQRRSA